MRREFACGMVIGYAVLLLAGCMSGDDKKIAAASVRVEPETEQLQVAEQLRMKTSIRDMAEAYDTILDHCTREFIGGYPVDESFLGWIQAAYGETVVERLADEVMAEKQDSSVWYKLTGSSIHVLWLLYCEDTGLEQYRLDNVYWKECADADRTVLDFSGDINFAEHWGTTEHMDAQPNGIYDCFSKALLTEMQSADICMINNEFTYSTRGEPLEGKAYTFRADPKRVNLLGVLGADIVSVANNHTYDYGEVALVDTLDVLDDAGMPYVGAGRDLKEAEKIVCFVANGRKIAITAATQIERSLNYTKEATENSAGVLKTLNPDKYIEVIREARKNSDVVIAFVHWGTEHDSMYGMDQVELADAFAEAGADVIIGGHTHCLQGVSYRQGVPVIYSLGNFWFSGDTLDTGLSQVVIEKDGSIRFRFLPCIQKNYRTSLVTDRKDKKRILNDMQRLSDGVSIDEDGYITEKK